MANTIKAFPASSRPTKSGALQYSQQYQIDQDGAPSVVFSRTSMKDGTFPPAGPVAADVSIYSKRFKNEATGYSDDVLCLSVRNIRAISVAAK
jgi:hypothetical protein